MVCFQSCFHCPRLFLSAITWRLFSFPCAAQTVSRSSLKHSYFSTPKSYKLWELWIVSYLPLSGMAWYIMLGTVKVSNIWFGWPTVCINQHVCLFQFSDGSSLYKLICTFLLLSGWNSTHHSNSSLKVKYHSLGSIRFVCQTDLLKWKQNFSVFENRQMSSRARKTGTSSNSASAHSCGFARDCLILVPFVIADRSWKDLCETPGCCAMG